MAFKNPASALHNQLPEPLTVQRLLTVPQVAQRLGVSTRKTWRLIAEGQLRAVRIGARGTRISDGEVDTFIAGLPGQPME